MRLFLILTLTATCVCHAAEESEALRIYLSRKFLQHVVDMPVENNRSISQTTLGTVIKGTAITKGNLTLQLAPTANNGVLLLHIDAETNSHSVGKNVPRKDITVHIYSTAKTTLTAEKAVIIYPDHLETRDAICSARTELTYGNLKIDATGIFHNLKEKIAHQQAAAKLIQNKASQEEAVSETAKKEMCKLLDDRVTPNLFRSLNVAFRRDFYQPLFATGRIPGDLHFTTMNGFLGVFVDEKDGLPQSALAMRPAFTPGAPVGARIHEHILTRTLSKRLEGRTMNEEDLEEYFILNGFPGKLAHYKSTDAQMQFRFGRGEPIALHFRDGGLDIELNADVVRLGEKLTSNLKVVGRYSLSATPEGDLRVQRLSVETNGGAPELQTRFARILPEQLTVNHMSVPEQLDIKGTICAKRVESKDGWMVVEWELRK